MKIKDLKRIIREELSYIQELGFDYPGKVKSQDLDQESDDYRRGYTDGLRDGYDRGFKDGQVGDLDENTPAKEPGTKEAPTKPDTGEKTKPRRGFEPKPGAEPKPKARSLKEEDMIKKITDRFKSLKK